LTLHALGLLCGLGATSLATWTAAQWRVRLSFLVGFLIGISALGADRFPQPGWTATVVAAVGALVLWKPAWSGLAALCGGVLAALWISILQLQGLPSALALIVGIGLPALSAILSARRPGFATQTLREESLVILIVLGLAIAMAPEIAAGWRSAIELKAVPLGAEQPTGAAWVLLVGGACVVLGGAYSFWRRR